VKKKIRRKEVKGLFFLLVSITVFFWLSSVGCKKKLAQTGQSGSQSSKGGQGYPSTSTGPQGYQGSTTGKDKVIQAHQHLSKYLKALLSLKLSAGVLRTEPCQSSRVQMEDMLSLVGQKALEQVGLIFM
jgi:hypothetical protein